MCALAAVQELREECDLLALRVSNISQHLLDISHDLKLDRIIALFKLFITPTAVGTFVPILILLVSDIAHLHPLQKGLQKETKKDKTGG